MGPSIVVRRLTQEDVEIWRTIRLEALRKAPEAFGQTYEAAAAEPIAYFASQLAAPGPIFAAFADGTAVGTAGIYRVEGPKTAHRANLWGVYVATAHRRMGVGRKLVLAALEHGGVSLEQVHLRVVADNTAAYGLYREMGFAPYGIEPRALRFNGRYFDEILMVRFLDREPTVPTG
jgi:ribosomal protein S18 acetylase RimI-like enzyme